MVRRPRLWPLLLTVAASVALGGSKPATASASAPPAVPRYGVVERSLSFRSSAANPWEQVNVDVELASPTGKTYRIGGFYAAPGLWKFRFAPSVLGRWTWSARASDGSNRKSYRGSFVVVRSGSPGFVRQSRFNRFRWAFQNGAPFYPIGLNECTDLALDRFGLDGGFRAPDDHIGKIVDMTTYLRTYGAAGFNLFRWGPDNCSYSLAERISPAGNVYSRAGGAATDRLFQALQSNGFRVEVVLFGSQPPFATSPDGSQLAAVERYVKYMVDRYGAYADFWELANEATVSESWASQVAQYLRQIDPYAHPVGTNWSMPQVGAIQFGTDHWYETEATLQSDAVAWAHFRNESARQFGKPTLVDEQGNAAKNWDPESAVRVRLRSWTAFFAESTLVFWNSSFAKDYQNPGAGNLYLGPDERRYVRVLQSYTRNFDPRAAVTHPPLTPAGAARGYALDGPRNYGLYLVASGNWSGPTTGLAVSISPRRAGTAVWTDPASGRVVAKTKVSAGTRSLSVPPFTVDLALKISY